jgi:uncharacterized protein (TIGR03066 family)
MTMRNDVVVHRPDGRRVPLVTWAAPVHLRSRGTRDQPSREAGAAVWVLEDLTSLHQAEAARKDAEGHLRIIVETMAEGLLVLDGRGRIVSCNPAACGFFGLTTEQLRSRQVLDLGWTFTREDGTGLPSEDHPAQAALRTGRPVRHFVPGAVPRTTRESLAENAEGAEKEKESQGQQEGRAASSFSQGGSVVSRPAPSYNSPGTRSRDRRLHPRKGRPAMEIVRLVVAAVLVPGLTVAVRAADEKKDASSKARLVGTWEVVKGKGWPRGPTVRFGKDGKVRLPAPRPGRGPRQTEGSYKVDKGKVRITLKLGDKERTLVIKITTLGDKQLVLEDTRGGSVTFKKLARAEKKDR